MTSDAPVDPIVGIDLGTTNSLIALVDPAGARILTGAEGRRMVPSMVSFADGTFLVGDPAKAHALEAPEDTVYSVKRLMGRAFADLPEAERSLLPYQIQASERGLAQVCAGGRALSPEEVSAMILRSLKERASQELGVEVRRAVITVPAYFDDAQRQSTRVAGQLAGLEVLRIVNEPTAAALAYGLDRARAGSVVVFDLGGGTFDVSVLEIRDGLFRVRSTAGDTHLGGDDFDRHLMHRLLAQLADGETADARLLQAVKQAAEAAKIQLSEHHQVELTVEDARTGRQLQTRVTREEFEQWIAPEVERAIDCCRRALADADLEQEDIKAVVLVGGSTRVPLVRQRVEEFFGHKPYTGLNPDEVVAIGAAVQADVLSGKSRDLLLLDVIPLSLGIETYGGAVAKVILRNSPVPAQAKDEFTTYVDNQTGLDIHVVQGERELVEDCRSLGRFHLRGLPALPAGMVRVEVHFLVDENGVLEVTARERESGLEAGIEVVPSFGLTDDEIAQIVQDSVVHARQDMARHQLIDLRNECRTMQVATDRILAAGNHGLDEDQVQTIRGVVQEVEAGLQTEDVKVLKALYDKFVDATVPLAGEVMTEVAQQVVLGRTIDEVLGGTPDKDCGDLGEGFRAAPASTDKEKQS